MRRHRSRFLLAAGAGLLMASPLAMQAQTPEEIKAYERRLQQLFEQLDRDGNRQLDRQESKGRPTSSAISSASTNTAGTGPADSNPAASNRRAPSGSCAGRSKR